jgi:hypothetical protein
MGKRLAALACSVAAVISLTLLSAPPLPANARPLAKAGPVIACFHPQARRYTAQAHPSRCHLRGYGETGVVGIPIKGMKWGHWGSNRTRAAYGVNERSGRRVRIIASHPSACEGRVWYSVVVVATLRNGNFFGLRLPTCDDSPVVGDGRNQYLAEKVVGQRWDSSSRGRSRTSRPWRLISGYSLSSGIAIGSLRIPCGHPNREVAGCNRLLP